MLGWWTVHYFIAGLLLVMLAMANDSGSVPSEQHASFILTCMTGQAIVAFSGTFAGLGFFWRKRRKLMFLLFGFLLIFGIGTEVFSFVKFANVAGESKTGIKELPAPTSALESKSETEITQDESL